MNRSPFIALFQFRSFNRKQALSAMGSLLLGVVFVLLASAFLPKETQPVAGPGETDRLFRISHWIDKPGEERLPSHKTSGLLAPALRDQLPEVEATGRLMAWPEPVPLSNGNGTVSAPRWTFADPTIPAILELDMLEGDAVNALAAPGQVIMTETMARKLFGTSKAVGKTFLGLGGKTYTVRGVVKNPSRESTVQFDLLASWSSTTGASGLHDFRFMNNWTSHAVDTYLLLRRPEDALLVEGRIPAAIRREAPEEAERYEYFLEPAGMPAHKSGAVGNAGPGKFSERYFSPHPGVSLLSILMPF